MGNCMSCCILEPYETSESEYLFAHKKSKPITKRKIEQTNLFYDSSLY